MNDNPRKKGFNYGIGWGPTPKPAIYHEAQQLALALNRVAPRIQYEECSSTRSTTS